MAKWKCDVCEAVTDEEETSPFTSSGKPMPILGWGCKQVGCRGRRLLMDKDSDRGL